MFCKYCGAEISDDSTFCSSCGANLTDGKKVNRQKKISEKGNTGFIILVICFCMIILSIFLPWVGLDHEKLKQTAINDMEEDYGIAGKYLGDQYMDLAYEMTPLEKAKNISLFSYPSYANSDYQGTTSLNVADFAILGGLLVLMMIIAYCYNLKNSKIIYSVILFIFLAIFLIYAGIYMHSAEPFYTGVERLTVSGGDDQFIDIYEYPGLGRVDASILEVGLTYKIGYFLCIISIAACAIVLFSNVIHFFTKVRNEKERS